MRGILFVKTFEKYAIFFYDLLIYKDMYTFLLTPYFPIQEISMTSLKPFTTVSDLVEAEVTKILRQSITLPEMQEMAAELNLCDLLQMNHPPMFITPEKSLWTQAVRTKKLNELMTLLQDVVIR